MMKTLRETIRELTAQHLDAGYLVMGETLTAVGWVGGTLPPRYDMTELPMSDVANSGFVVGAALMGKRPMYIIRYQGFLHFNAAIISNYAAKSKALWGRPCPLLVRAIAMEGRIGPTTGSCHHSLFTRMPGVKVFAPMTPGEWHAAYADFMEGDDVVVVSEHRRAYDNATEFTDLRPPRPALVLFPCSITRLAAQRAALELQNEGIFIAVHPVWCLKPFSVTRSAMDDLFASAHGGVVLDDEYPGGVASHIALRLHEQTGARMQAYTLEDRTAGFAEALDNLPPSVEQIKVFVRTSVRG